MLRDALPLRAPAVAITTALAALSPALASARTAPPERVDLHWTAPSECPGPEAVRAEMERLLGPSSARPPAPIPVTAAVSRDPGGAWHVRLETAGEGTTRVREIHGASCAAIADATALILAMRIDPSAAAAAPPIEADRSPLLPDRSPLLPDRSPVAASQTPIAASRRPIAATKSPIEASTPPTLASFRVSALAGLDTASLPGITAILGLGGSFVYGPQRFDLGIEYRPSRTATVPGRPSAGGDVDLLTGTLDTCRHLGAAPIEVGPCLGFELGRLHASGSGVSSPGEGSTLWAAVLGGGVGTYRVFEHLALVVRLGAAVPLLRPSFVLENVGAVFRPPAVTARGSGGIEWIF